MHVHVRALLASLILLMSASVLTPPSNAAEVSAGVVTYTSHAPITIENDSSFTSTNGVVSGSGASDDPYIIEGWEIGPTNGTVAINIIGTHSHFTIRQVHLTHTFTGISLLNVNNGRIENSMIDNQTVGILFYQCDSFVSVDNTISDCELGIRVYLSNNLRFDDIHYLRDVVNIQKPSRPWEQTWLGETVCLVVLIPLFLLVAAAFYFRFFAKKPRPPPPDMGPPDQ